MVFGMRVGGGDELKLKILCMTDTIYKSNIPQNHNFCKQLITINLISYNKEYINIY